MRVGDTAPTYHQYLQHASNVKHFYRRASLRFSLTGLQTLSFLALFQRRSSTRRTHEMMISSSTLIHRASTPAADARNNLRNSFAAEGSRVWNGW